MSPKLLEQYDNRVISTNFCKVLQPKEHYAAFIYNYWKYLYEQQLFFTYENGTTGIKNLNLQDVLEKETIVLPPLEEVQKFALLWTNIENTVMTNGTEIQRLADLRDALLPRLMSGELDVSELAL